MSPQPVKRLSQLEIDEVSLVDRPANQHGLVTITKRDEGTGMTFFDQQGREVDEADLQSGDVVFNDQGEPIQLFSDEDLQELLDSGEIDETDLLADERELATVGKGAAAVTGGPSTIERVVGAVRGAAQNTRLGYVHGRTGNAPSSSSVGNLARRSRQAGAHVGRNKNAYIAGAAAGTEENARSRFRKAAAQPSLGEQVLSDLSKALTDGDRDQVISKALDRVSKAEQAAADAVAKAARLEEQAELAEYTEVAKSFELPVETDDLAGLLQVVAKSAATDAQLDLFERILYTASAAVARDLEELGSSGTSPIMGYVGEAAREVVGKNDGLTEEQATVAIMAANDEVYLDYLSEQRG